jgi:hypothetical protein
MVASDLLLEVSNVFDLEIHRAFQSCRLGHRPPRAIVVQNNVRQIVKTISGRYWRLTEGIFGDNREYLSDVMRDTKLPVASLFDLKVNHVI